MLENSLNRVLIVLTAIASILFLFDNFYASDDIVEAKFGLIKTHFVPEEAEDTRDMIDCGQQDRFYLPEDIEFQERNSPVNIIFKQAEIVGSELKIPFAVESEYLEPILYTRLTWSFPGFPLLLRKMFLTDGYNRIADFLTESSLADSTFSIEAKESRPGTPRQYMIYNTLPEIFKDSIPILDKEKSNFSLELDVRLEYKNLEESITDDPTTRLHSFVGSKEFKLTLHFSSKVLFTDDLRVQLLQHYNNWFNHHASNTDVATKHFSFNYAYDKNLNPQCETILTPSKHKYISKKNIEVIFFVDSQPKAECNTLKKRYTNLEFFFDQRIRVSVKCNLFRYSTTENINGYFNTYKSWLKHELVLPPVKTMKKKPTKKLFINFSGIHDVFCANLDVFENPEPYIQTIRDLIELSYDMSTKSLYEVEFYFMSTTIMQNIVWEKNWFLNQVRNEYINKVLRTEVEAFESFTYIDTGYYSKVGEFDTRSKNDIRHLSRHTNEKLLTGILCQGFKEYL